MKHPNYTIEQAEFIHHVKEKVANFFETYPIPAHGFDHVARVARWAEEISLHESPDHTFITVLAGWLHDIGRVPEVHDNPESKTHQELSYDLLRLWMRDDLAFYYLKDAEKVELLYAVRYHWNNYADRYKSAIFLRDADKMDLFGDIGLQRAIETHHSDRDIDFVLRLHFEASCHLQTTYARQKVEELQLLVPLHAYLKEKLQAEIKPIVLK